ncbi:unnamed protein product [Pedinophyceae sp. YPF-701]|nr:unnamed protein product [Pedinophyceae sp. YPF-701]
MAPKKGLVATPGQKSIASFFAKAPKPAASRQTPVAAPKPAAGLKASRTSDAAGTPENKVQQEAEDPPTLPVGSTPPSKTGSRTAKRTASGGEPAAPPAKRSKDATPAKKAQKAKEKAFTPNKKAAKDVAAATPAPKETTPAHKQESDVGSKWIPAGPDAIGTRLEVYWEDESDWFAGAVADYDADEDKHLVEYDDGDEEWLELAGEKTRPTGPKPARPTRRAVRRAKAAKADDDESGMSELEDSDEEGSEEGDEDSASEFEAGASDAEEEAADDDDAVDDDASMDDADSGEDSDADVAPRAPKRAKKAAPAKREKPAAKARADTSPAPAERMDVDGGAEETPAAARPGVETPASDPKKAARLRRALDDGSAGADDVAAGGGSGKYAVVLGHMRHGDMTGEAASYLPRYHTKFPFLRPDRIRDAAGKRPGQPGYNPRTLAIPPGFFKEAKISPGQQQWWEFKAANFDSVLLFKMGKFYEMFEMDAHVGVEVLGLAIMRGDQPHAGFPEVNYHAHAEMLVRAGYRVVVVEQTETPQQLAERNDRRPKGTKKDTVVRREAVAVLTRGTLYDPEMLHGSTDATWIMALVEPRAAGDGRGGPAAACFCDVATGQVRVGFWEDDALRSTLRRHLTALQPVEVLLPKDGHALRPSAATLRVLRGCLRSPRYESLPCGNGAEARERLLSGGYYSEGAGGDAAKGPRRVPPPEALGALADAGAGGELGLTALGVMVQYLSDVLLDRAVLPLARIEILAGTGERAAPADTPSDTPSGARCLLDGAALENLDVLESADGGAAGSLLHCVDNCVTSSGRRLLREWLLRPLVEPAEIADRQGAVADLLGAASDAMAEARTSLSKVADLERALARLFAAVAGGGTGRDAARVVLYEDMAKRRIRGMVSAMQGLRNIVDAMEAFAGVVGECKSALLRALVTPGSAELPDIRGELGELEGATDWGAAATEGRVRLNRGVDAAFDDAVAQEDACDAALQEYLEEARGRLGGSSQVAFVSIMSNSHLIEVPEAAWKRVPSDWELMGQRKGFKRYTSEDLKALVADRDAALAAKEVVLSDALSALMGRFASHAALWRRAVAAASQLDAIMSLAVACATSDGAMCRPRIVAPDSGGSVFRAAGLRHPAGIRTQQGQAFVPNDICLGGDAAPMLVLTGPNMGGKSTLLRQVCLTAILAQIGAYVPAESLELTPCDAIFVRMGARDRIMAGQSTFFLELSETATMLSKATARSLVALDELGRGTSTSDGAAIASAVLDSLVADTKCRGLFATHYHRLAGDHEGDAGVAIKHMACHVEESEDGKPASVAFLYKLAEGSCPFSYGVNVARLAGLPESVITRAAGKATELEAQMLVRGMQRAAAAKNADSLRSLWRLAQHA